jgi:hypothetical protein
MLFSYNPGGKGIFIYIGGGGGLMFISVLAPSGGGILLEGAVGISLLVSIYNKTEEM